MFVARLDQHGQKKTVPKKEINKLGYYMISFSITENEEEK